IEQRNDNLQQQKSTLEIRAAYDDLTGLGNRTLLMDSLQKQIQEFPDNPFSLLLMDLDNFRRVNDTAGHVVGDTILVEVARRLKYAMPDRDQLFRLEGDEFAIIHRNVTSQQEVRQYTGRLRSVFDQSFDIGETSFRTTASFGIAHYPQHGQTPLMLYRSADSAVILAKSSGKNREMEFDSEQDTEHRIRLDLSERLEQAIRKSELSLYFQPIVDLRSRQTIGAEALLRWKEPELGFVAPDVFIPIAEETGQILEIGRLVLAQALEALSQWNRVAPGFSVSVNVSPGELGRPGLISDVSALLARYQVEPANLKLEITETMLMEDKNISLLHSLRELGVRLVMDDFGTGYSSFAYLQKFLFDVLKIDKSFVLRLGTDDTVQPLVQAMIQMAHSLRMQVVAEGIETDEVATFLTNESCEMGQGYLYDPALPMDEFTARYLRPFRTSTV
ncbi:MAG: bifunctional diguanylate cyclase/phosphodiesterase, partial [Leptospiraceae bacterium]|nr:bifunctional diguanylate cyclase/phosphodiesterase [Leptospiraceae bacterium]